MPEFRARRHKKRLRCDLARLLLLPNVVQGREETRHGLRKNKITTKALRICGGGGSCSTTVHPRCSAATCTFPSGGRDTLYRDSKKYILHSLFLLPVAIREATFVGSRRSDPLQVPTGKKKKKKRCQSSEDETRWAPTRLFLAVSAGPRSRGRGH